MSDSQPEGRGCESRSNPQLGVAIISRIACGAPSVSKKRKYADGSVVRVLC
jgi:hypothetical protein